MERERNLDELRMQIVKSRREVVHFIRNQDSRRGAGLHEEAGHSRWRTEREREHRLVPRSLVRVKSAMSQYSNYTAYRISSSCQLPIRSIDKMEQSKQGLKYLYFCVVTFSQNRVRSVLVESKSR